ncbi:hypothetical protein ACFO0U_04175 [Chromohalobacter sarecensis]|uniref:DUF7305 domain-containing protein n=1 Tax=Chromohalobacter sarecensis TaxID=245294 RepID=A0ABV9CXV5_9GAMM|nr:hypothetical protein [Chromohalobacter sarecensis]MCK0716151.1 hypothetical protein [Chromohalobacter sarecensis]
MNAPKQSGFVLVVGLMLLTVASGAVVSSMSLNKYQERQAGNYVRTNNYVAGADEAFRRFQSTEEGWGEDVKAVVEGRLGDSEEGAIIFPYDGDENWLPSDEREGWAQENKDDNKEDDDDIKYAFTQAGIKKIFKTDESQVRVEFWGQGELSGNDVEGNNGQEILHAYYSITKGEEDDDDQPGSAYREVLMGCEGVDVSGGGVIDSYDSRDGSYGGENSKRSVAKISSISQGGDIVLSSGQPVYGDVESAGGIRIGNSGPIHGDLKANDDIVIDNGGAKILGNVATRQAVRFITSGLIQGDVEANKEIVTGNWSSRIDGNATAPIVRTTTDRDVAEQVGGKTKRVSPNVTAVPEVENGQQSCEAFTSSTSNGATIDDLTGALDDPSDYPSSGNLPQSWADYKLTPDGLSGPSYAVPNPERYKVTQGVTVDGIFPESTNLLVLDSFSLTSGNIDVEGGDMTIYVKGDVDISNGTTLSIAEGSSLKIVTEGSFTLKSNLKVESDSPTDDEGNPILSLYSTYDDGGANAWNAGVNISADSAFKGTIFAPKSTVNVAAGGGLYGAVKGRRVEVSGGAGIHYDEALMESTIGIGGGQSGNDSDEGDENGENSGNTWKLEGLSYGNPEA